MCSNAIVQYEAIIGKGVGMESRGEVCLEEEVDRLRRSGMSVQEISASLGLEPTWVAQVVEMMPDEESPGAEQDNTQGIP
ncbi:hypothetical protein BH23ACT11_BH23ACT11_04730 [soil metagenome]